MAEAGDHMHEPVPLARRGEAPLLVARLAAGLARWEPDLIEMDRLLPMVVLRVHDASAGGHALDLSSCDHLLVPHAVLMGDPTLQHHGDDLHVAMAMHAKPASRNDDIIVEDPQRTE